jgi:type II secretory pathway pseudopilin PulG
MAAVILGLAAAALLGAIGQSQSTLERLSDRRKATMIAESLLDEYQLGLIDTQGELGDDPNWSWQLEEKNLPRGKELRITVSWPKARGRSTYTLTTLAGTRP